MRYVKKELLHSISVSLVLDHYVIQTYEGHFRGNENVIILAYSILLTGKVIY